jgi:SNF2 family DNA or RNA helicase
MKFVPEPYQIVGAQHLVSGLARALFAGMGLGKTAMTLFALDNLFRTGRCKGALVIAPIRVCNLTWPNEVELWEQFRWMKVANLRSAEGIKMWLNQSADIYVINYEALPTFVHKYIANKKEKDMPVCTLVWDELSKAKNHTSVRVESLRRHWHKFNRHWGLTGTPTPNHKTDLFAQIRLLDGGVTLGSEFGGFRKRHFFATDYEGRQFGLIPGQEMVIERAIAGMCLVLRSSDYLDIPDTEVIDIDATMPAESWAHYKKLKKELLLLIDHHEITAVNAAVLIGKLTQITSGSVYDKEGRIVVFHDDKIKLAAKVIKEQENQPLMIAFQYRHEEERLRKAFPQAVCFSDAKTAVKQTEVAEAWNHGLIPVLIVHPQSAGHGLNLQHGGSDILWFSIPWSRELYDQMNGRVARKGQKRTPRVFRLIVPKTVDDAVAEALRQKGDDQTALMNTIHNFKLLAKCAA